MCPPEGEFGPQTPSSEIKYHTVQLVLSFSVPWGPGYMGWGSAVSKWTDNDLSLDHKSRCWGLGTPHSSRSLIWINSSTMDWMPEAGVYWRIYIQVGLCVHIYKNKVKIIIIVVYIYVHHWTHTYICLCIYMPYIYVSIYIPGQTYPWMPHSPQSLQDLWLQQASHMQGQSSGDTSNFLYLQ